VTKFDRYMLSQFLILFGFFALVLVAVFWINRAVLLFDQVIGNGQSALVFLEFSALGLPKLIVTVLPVATFASSVYVINRMTRESELTVLQATGSSPWRLARPVFVYGLCVAVMMSILTHFLLPLAGQQLSEREEEITRNVTARLLTEGTFLHPTPKVTFYTRAINADGVLRDVFLSDRRDPEEGIIYTASEAYLIRNGDGTTLIMVDGMAQRLLTEERRLATAKFQDFSFDISSLVNRDSRTSISTRNMITPATIRDWGALEGQTGESRGKIAEEVHSRFAQPLFCIIAAMIGYATLLLGGYSRFGVWREVVIAFGLLIAIDGVRSTLVRSVRADSGLWPVMYLPAIIGSILVFIMLWQAAHPGWIRRLWARMRAPA